MYFQYKIVPEFKDQVKDIDPDLRIKLQGMFS